MLSRANSHSAGPAAPVALSIVLPVYNEEDNLELLHAELTGVLQSLGLSYEIVYVNDGSRDTSIDILKTLAATSPHVLAIDLRRNFGQTAAMAAGIDYSTGDVVIFMDSDLQNDPADIPLLLDTLNQGYDVVSGWRRHRHDNWLTRHLPSVLANGLISVVTGVALHDYGCTLKAYRRDVLDEVRLYGELHRFIPVIASASGARIAEVVVNHRARKFGKSKYGLARTFKVLLDLITVKFLLSYRTTPMYLFGTVGLLFIAAGFLVLLAAIINRWLTGVSLIQTPLPTLAATLAGLGIQSFLLGLTAEVMLRTYHESQDKPIYAIRDTYAATRHVPQPDD